MLALADAARLRKEVAKEPVVVAARKRGRRPHKTTARKERPEEREERRRSLYSIAESPALNDTTTTTTTTTATTNFVPVKTEREDEEDVGMGYMEIKQEKDTNSDATRRSGRQRKKTKKVEEWELDIEVKKALRSREGRVEKEPMKLGKRKASTVALPDGWRMEWRHTSPPNKPPRADPYWYSPSGKVYRSVKQLVPALEEYKRERARQHH